jgi:DNA-binding transcriptional ArsR family regulator
MAGHKPDRSTLRTPGRFAYEGLDRVIHEKARLGILASLAVHPQGLVFGDLKELCALTDGNLSRHLAVLTEAGFVEVWKGVHRNRPQTLCRLTPDGKRRFLDYVSVLENVVVDAARAEQTRRAPRAVRSQPGWANS